MQYYIYSYIYSEKCFIGHLNNTQSFSHPSTSSVMCYQDTEVSFHLKHVHLKPAAASSLLVLPTGLNETGHSYT